MIIYTDILGEAYEDNHVNFVNYFHSKEKLSVRKDRIEIMYIEWFLAKAQIVERDFFIDGDSFIQRCLNECTIILPVLAKDESNKNMILDFTFMLSALNLMCKAIDEAPEDETEADNKKSFADYLTCDDKDKMIEKIRKADRDTPKSIYIILKALFDNGLLTISNNETIYKAYHAEFGYHKDYETLKRGLNYYDIDKSDTKNQQKIGNMYEHLTS